MSSPPRNTQSMPQGPKPTAEGAADFYDALAPMFDVMTDWEARLASEGPFLREVLGTVSAHRVLDAACGSGGHALALARWGYETVGADVSPGMIGLARGKSVETGQDVPFFVADLAGLPAQFYGQPFDAVLCLGNTLPHLLTQDALVAALSGMAGVLRPGGLLITQQLNYDLRWRTRPRFFAAEGGNLQGQEVLVWRFADYADERGQIDFHVAVFRKGPSGWDVNVHTTPQRPLMYADLSAGLRSAGFDHIQAYAGMTWPAPPFDVKASADLIVVARRTGS